MLKDLAHYLSPECTKGSKVDVGIRSTNEDGETQAQLIQEYIIYDFETDTHTNIHKPNYVSYDVLSIDENRQYSCFLISSVSEYHEYNRRRINSGSFEGYGCEDKFCNWLFSEELNKKEKGLKKLEQ